MAVVTDHRPFVHRAFPPPALANVPLEYVIDQLHRFAVHYWDKPQTADCTIIVPLSPGKPTYNNARPPTPLSPLSINSELPSCNFHDPAGLGRRVTEPAVPRVTRITCKLHIDYLSAQSSLLRDLFSGSSTPDPSAASTTPASRASLPVISTPANRLPRLIPSAPHHPVVWLPLPDPASFPHLMHYMYFGRTAYMEECLDRKLIRWEGVVRNVEYLGMRTDIKVFLGRWYGNWLAPPHARAGARPPVVREDDDSANESDSDDGSEECVSDEDSAGEESEDEDVAEPSRGRTRTRMPRFIRAPPRPRPAPAIHSL